MPIVSVSMDDSILRSLDDVAQRRRYRSRSEAVREALREFIDVTEWGREDGEARHPRGHLREGESARGPGDAPTPLRRNPHDASHPCRRSGLPSNLRRGRIDSPAEGAHRATPPNQGSEGDQVHPDRGPSMTPPATASWLEPNLLPSGRRMRTDE